MIVYLPAVVTPEMVSGRLVRFLVEENDQVEQDQVLAEIEPVHYRDQVEQARGKLELAEAELKRQEAGLAKLKKEVPLQIDVATQSLAGARIEEARAKDTLKLTTDEVNKTIDEAQAAVEVAKANVTLAKQEYDRFTELARQDATTTRKAQEVTRAFDAARAEVRLADAKLAGSRESQASGLQYMKLRASVDAPVALRCAAVEPVLVRAVTLGWLLLKLRGDN